MQFHIATRGLWSAFAGAVLALTTGAQLQAASLPPGFTLGSPNVAIADPTLPRPPTTPCSVTLFSKESFADFSSHPFSYAPPAACPGPWAKVVLEVDMAINAGVQYDRTAHIWLAGANIYTGTTEEPSSTEGPNWHAERDITDYSPLLRAAQTGAVDLQNLVNSTYTGILTGTARLQFYPKAAGIPAPRVPDVVYPMTGGSPDSAVTLGSPSDQLAQTITFPANVERAFIDVLTQGQSNDEFWYSCVPTALASELDSCGSTSFREAEISIDGQPAGVAPVYPWIFTGGVDPFLWRPTPGVQTLNLLPYRVDISPFAGLLSNDHPHQVAISVYNADSYFLASGAVLVYQDQRSAKVVGAVTRNTLVAAAAPTIDNEIAADSAGNVTGTLTTSSARAFTIEGYIQTAHGRVDMAVSQNMHYRNTQSFTINSSAYVQDITQHTQVDTDTTVRGDRGEALEHHHLSYPLTMNISYLTASDGSSAQTTTVDLAYDGENSLTIDGWPMYSGKVHNEVTPSDTLDFDAAGNFTGNTGQQSTQTFDFSDSLASCYKREVASSAGLLTAVTDGRGCHDGRDFLPWFVDPFGLALPEISTLNLYR
jgi:peptide N-acetyl-beta-D-glucosaminyl asparaginase amidase A